MLAPHGNDGPTVGSSRRLWLLSVSECSRYTGLNWNSASTELALRRLWVIVRWGCHRRLDFSTRPDLFAARGREKMFFCSRFYAATCAGGNSSSISQMISPVCSATSAGNTNV